MHKRRKTPDTAIETAFRLKKGGDIERKKSARPGALDSTLGGKLFNRADKIWGIVKNKGNRNQVKFAKNYKPEEKAKEDLKQ